MLQELVTHPHRCTFWKYNMFKLTTKSRAIFIWLVLFELIHDIIESTVTHFARALGNKWKQAAKD